jgi:formylglycine-generating enzyme required for sulfatase activity
VVKTVVVNEGLVNEFYRYLDEGKLVSSKENCAFKILMTIKNNDKLSATYPELRSAFIGAVIDEDTKIYYKYLNQDVFPWYSKFYDIEKEIQMQESLLQILKSDDFMYRSSCSKYYFYQAMTLYEFAKLEYEGKKRENRFKKAQKLIKIAIKLNENSPVLKMMQNRIDLAISRKNTAELKRYEEARLLAPDWRIPYIYSDNAKSARKYEELIVDFDRRTMEKAVTIPNLTYLSVKNRKKSNIYDPAIFKQSFESNPFILEDVYLNRILHSKTPGQYLSFHIPLAREAYDRSVRHSYGDKSENRNYQYSELISHVDTISENNKIAERLSINEILAEFNQWGRYPTIEDPLAGKFILVKSGLFRMGCMNQTENCRMIPAHDVILGDFYIGETEVTWAQWKAVMGTEASKYVFKCDSCPVENLSWEDVQRFIKILNLRTGKKYRLPTEAEWEYAARGGRKSNRYAFAGNSDVDSVAWFGGNSGSRLRPQKLKLPNELGLYDMSGNVQEWCSDWFAPYSDVSSFQINPQGPEQGSHRVARGGGWLSPSNNCRVTSRSSYPPNSKMYNLGFRLALTPVKLW